MPIPKSSPSSGQTPKKQQTISSFFTPKCSAPPAVKADKAPSGDALRSAGPNGQLNSDSLFLSDDEEPPLSGSRRQNSASKRGPNRDSDDLNYTDDDDTSEPPAKRSKALKDTVTNLVPTSHDRENASSRQHHHSHTAQKLNKSDRTSKYLFSSSPVPAPTEAEDGKVQAEKDRLHRKFIKKLGRPDSFAELRRRNRIIDEDGGGTEAAEGEEDEDEAPAEKPKAKRGGSGKGASSKLTPMERQVIEIKKKHMDTILVVEVGYKFRFFGEDARIAAKELSIVCIPGKMRFDEHPSEAHLDRFASASIPVHRLHVHVKRLVAAGHKVGVVRQLETAALKAAGDNRNAPFVRKLTNLYTKGTYIDDIEGLGESVDGPSGGAPASGHLLCITETNAKGWGTDEKVHVGIIAVQPATGDVIYDDFEDGFMRSEIETRLLHISPCEFLIVGELSKATEKLVHHLSGSKSNVFGDRIRVERVGKPKTVAAQSYSHVAKFYAGKMKSSSSEADSSASTLLDKVLALSEPVTICLSAMITHLTDYGLEHVFDLTKYFQSFSARSHMLLNGNTLTSLELYKNQTDNNEKGSLFWALDRTQTRFGQRLLRKWVGRPLLDKGKLEERVAAVEELLEGNQSAAVEKLKGLLSRTKSDLEKSLIRIYYGKCTRHELLTVLQTLQRIADEFGHVKSPENAGFKSDIISKAIANLPVISEVIVGFLEKINPEAAKNDDKYSFFRENEETEDITEHKMGIAGVEHELDDHRAVAAEKVGKRKVDYVTVAGIEYLIEMDNTQLKKVPASWVKVSGTKKVSRFHTPEVTRLIRERDQHKESLAAACDAAFSSLLRDISLRYQDLRDCIQSLATLDCLVSLAEVAGQPGYVKPEYTDDACVCVKEGRHPMVEQLLLESYVPNDIDLSSHATRALLITGPNMGGKSSYVRQVALISIMGQIGSYVPASYAKLGMLDAVFTRMGAFDNMMAGESTFMVELSETSDILKQATSRSLVILDELGRGTSTHDGVAIAQAVLDYIVRETKSLTLFITHYQSLSTLTRGFPDGELKNVHMKFTERGEDGRDITFLYEIGEGVAHRSYGLNVARLANVPSSVLELAAVKSKELEENVKDKTFSNISTLLQNVMAESASDHFEQLVTGIDQL
ncbi:DNA mismatch repair protein-like protein msh3 [Xylona heveae TC161]|uniref:DNA mismatch repair protein MSH3 n=1 Tax=Xylona heveae (strain CBS 132557 / TC161) TaxID=1328760 RepID=A0A165JYL5_XYLHT|nr:DNA mismatch repair protein-like protein msh3 [Xylona heveae TC161]KZF26791.1 DNA mismatch repair protein-like protein msh3 [Xylona heveae TC161]